MRFAILILYILFFSTDLLLGQSKTDLEEQRKKTLEEISYVDNILKSTAKEKSEGINSLRILGSKLTLRESVIKGMGSEIELLNDRIQINQIAIDMMERDLQELKKEYSEAVLNSYKTKKINPEIVYILSAKDFNQGYKRVKYLQQVTRFRREESEIIYELKEQIEGTKERLEKDLFVISDLRHKEVQQKNMLKSEQEKKQRIIKTLGTKEKQLQRELAEKKRIADKLEKDIAKIIEAEKRKSTATQMTPEQKLISENFSGNKGRLPWPVERGIITSQFGKHQHPVLKYVTEDNFGVEITSSGKTVVRSVFKGEVSAISALPGSNMTIIIRHGKYMTVYNNVVNVKVKKGDIVDTKQIIGEVFQDPGANNNCILKFMIFENSYLDPEQWITKI